MSAKGLLEPKHLGISIGGKVYIKTPITKLEQIGVRAADGNDTLIRPSYIDPAIHHKPSHEAIYTYVGGQYYCHSTLIRYAARKGIPVKPLIKGSVN